MIRLISFTLVVMVSISFIFKSKNHVSPHKRNPASDQVAQDTLLAEALLSFEEKFRRLTPDIHELSEKNVEVLNQIFRKTRDLEKYIPRANDENVEEIFNKLIFTHETSVKTAEAILKSNAFLSIDELVRRKILDASFKKSRYRVPFEGKIGDQDVLFVALQEKNFSRVNFGPVRFILKKSKIMDAGYFSPRGFTDVFVPYNGKSDVSNEEKERETLSRYEKIAFSGEKALKSLLKLALVQTYWDFDHPVDKALVQDVIKYFSLLGDDGDRQNPLEARSPVTDFLHFFGQVSPKGKIFWQYNVKQALTSEEAYVPQDTNVQPNVVLDAFNHFPMNLEGLPVSLLERYSFWEYKIPVVINGDAIEGIALCDRSDRFKADFEAFVPFLSKWASDKKIKLEPAHGFCNEYSPRGEKLREYASYRFL